MQNSPKNVSERGRERKRERKREMERDGECGKINLPENVSLIEVHQNEVSSELRLVGTDDLLLLLQVMVQLLQGLK